MIVNSPEWNIWQRVTNVTLGGADEQWVAIYMATMIARYDAEDHDDLDKIALARAEHVLARAITGYRHAYNGMAEQ